jgi:hypothetical protein
MFFQLGMKFSDKNIDNLRQSYNIMPAASVNRTVELHVARIVAGKLQS